MEGGAAQEEDPHRHRRRLPCEMANRELFLDSSCALRKDKPDPLQEGREERTGRGVLLRWFIVGCQCLAPEPVVP